MNIPNQMNFLFDPPNKPREIFGDAWLIFGDGPVDDGAAARLTRLVEENKVLGSSVLYLNSPGGSLVGGMALGRAIRRAGLFTYIGKAGALDNTSTFKYRERLSGGCYSAATLAFLGGVYRWIDEKSEYGVHRFYADTDPGSDLAQAASAQIVDFVREMGVDPQLFSEMSKAGRHEINLLNIVRLVQLNVTNGPTNETTWSVESVGEGLYLKGQRIAFRGVNKFILMPGENSIVLYAIFNPEGRGDEVLQMGAHSLFINGDTYPLTDGKVAMNKGLVNGFFGLSDELVVKLKDASTVGVAFQWAYGAPIFLGFEGMKIDEADRAKIKGYLGIFGK